MAHCVHVAPANRDVHLVNQGFLVGDFYFHNSVIVAGLSSEVCGKQFPQHGQHARAKLHRRRQAAVAAKRIQQGVLGLLGAVNRDESYGQPRSALFFRNLRHGTTLGLTAVVIGLAMQGNSQMQHH